MTGKPWLGPWITSEILHFIIIQNLPSFLTTTTDLRYSLQTWTFILREKFTYFIEKLQYNRQKNPRTSYIKITYESALVMMGIISFHSIEPTITLDHLPCFFTHHLWNTAPRMLDNTWKAHPQNQSLKNYCRVIVHLIFFKVCLSSSVKMIVRNILLIPRSSTFSINI